MEPMLVGSPSNTTSPHMGRGGNTYLPSFLTGESFISSPQIQSFGGNFYVGNQPNRLPLTDRSFNVGHSTTIGRNESFSRPTNKSKMIGPPIQSLQESLITGNESFNNSNLQEIKPNQSVIANTESDVYKFQLTNPFVLDETTNQSLCMDDSKIMSEVSWVTVFGYNPNQTSLILDDFREYGVIIKYIVHPTGNWMHIKYRSGLQVKHALSKNGCIFKGNYMIGVKICSDKEILDFDSKNPKTCKSPEYMNKMNLSQNPLFNVDSNSSINTSINHVQIPEKSKGILERIGFW